MAELIDWLQSAPFGALALVTALLSAVVAVVVVMLTRMKMTNKDKSSCDFGQYDELWKNHKYSCMKIIRITNDYIVHVDTQHNIDWETTEAYDSTKTEEEKIASEKALSHCLIAERKPIGGLSDEAVLSFKTIIGEAIVNCLEKITKAPMRYLNWQTSSELTVSLKSPESGILFLQHRLLQL